MKMLLALVAALAVGVAHAGTNFNFSPATDGTYKCQNYCSGYVTDSSDTVEYVNVQWYDGTSGYRITLSVDGQLYQGFASSAGQQFTALGVTIDGVTGISYTGTYALVSVTWSSKRTCTHSGRGQHCTTWYFPTTGSVLVP